MRVAIDSGPLTSGHAIRGVGVYTRSLIEALKKESGRTLARIEAVDFRNTDLSNFDVVHYPYFSLFQKTLDTDIISSFNSRTTKVVVTIHDLIPLIYPKNYPSGLKGRLNFYYQKRQAKKADAIVTDTQTSKKDIVRFLNINPDKIHVVYLAPRKIFRKIKDKVHLENIRKKYNLPKEFVLYVGDVNYNKNIFNLIKACKIAKLPLVIVGKQITEINDVAGQMKSMKGPRDFVRFLAGKPHPEIAHYKSICQAMDADVITPGFVPDGDLVAVFNLAKVYCQPSLYEGFGLPVLEAIACGTPVVASKTQALVEIAEGAATFFDPYDPEDMAKSFGNLIKSPKLPRIYSWERCAKETLDVYETLMSKF